MNSARTLVFAIGLVLGAQPAFAQDIARYRTYALDSSVDSIVARAPSMPRRFTSGLRQSGSWNGARHTPLADPVRDIAFTFYNVESLSAAYGVPALASAKTRTSPPAGASRCHCS